MSNKERLIKLVLELDWFGAFAEETDVLLMGVKTSVLAAIGRQELPKPPLVLHSQWCINQQSANIASSQLGQMQSGAALASQPCPACEAQSK